MYDRQFFFQPSTDLTRVVPLFIFLALIVVILIIIALAIYYYRFDQKRKHEMHWFRSHALDFGLTKNDTILMLRWANKAGVHHLPRLLTNVEAFERLMKYVGKQNPITKQKLGFSSEIASRIRVQLYGKDIAPNQKIETTNDLRPGLRLFIRYINQRDQAVWGHLVDIENDGMIVVIPNPKEIKIPLRPETRIEVTAYIPKNDPITFNTKVKTAVPGPRKMIVIEHSSFMIPNKYKRIQSSSQIPPLLATSAI